MWFFSPIFRQFSDWSKPTIFDNYLCCILRDHLSKIIHSAGILKHVSIYLKVAII